MALISLDHVSKIYPKATRAALDDITLHINRGDFVFLVGASGSGKTSLLRMLTHEEEATGGEIRVAGHDLRRMKNRQVPQYRRQIGTIFQDYKLLTNKTVWQNVAFALEVIGTSRSTIKSLVPKVLETVGLTGKEKNYPHELSGGEQQRVTIARAYVNHPQILLADEPTGNLDPTTSLGIMEVLDAINRTGTTIVMATHNEEIVNSMRKRVVELHTGKIVRDQEHGVYDSTLYFPDAKTEAQAHVAISSLGVEDTDAATVSEHRHGDAAGIAAVEEGARGLAALASSASSNSDDSSDTAATSDNAATAATAAGSAADTAATGSTSDADDPNARFRPGHAGDDAKDARDAKDGKKTATDTGAAASGEQTAADREQTAADMVTAVSDAIHSDYSDEGIARLAKSVHSGNTGRYGEAFAPLEHTLTWGKGLDLDEYAERATSREEAQAPAATPAPPAPPAPPKPPVRESSDKKDDDGEAADEQRNATDGHKE
ncbi:cell division ATP-binding protein FtsE [Bifidobacterium choloepi]|uniref:Cell division ATP-binding protein FtsE n=1 Tax=Bifidobacterium choloepi TaxID=2614131 RepID=A0A6I5N050_9BIFI|nr:cell division ATP-binding protein FtsE [Bifidobacterium choloepi]NEG69485.1 cell division ATP-binding protein FtsE [Bifidobacterium choloepi]